MEGCWRKTPFESGKGGCGPIVYWKTPPLETRAPERSGVIVGVAPDRSNVHLVRIARQVMERPEKALRWFGDQFSTADFPERVSEVSPSHKVGKNDLGEVGSLRNAPRGRQKPTFPHLKPSSGWPSGLITGRNPRCLSTMRLTRVTTSGPGASAPGSALSSVLPRQIVDAAAWQSQTRKNGKYARFSSGGGNI